MIDIAKFMETEYGGELSRRAASLGEKILVVAAGDGETIGKIFNRFPNINRQEIMGEIQKLRDDGLVTVEPAGTRRKTLMIRAVG